ncbi:MAG: DUF5615 family PIN-like protein [Fimbriimonadales bacterium]|nr:DUF5615 family PIN-like protein [Fimbriimonadales bacterium]
MRFLIDEDLPHTLTDIFAAAGYEALHVREVGLRGMPDEQIAAYAQTHHLCLVTADLGFADVRIYPPAQYAGIVVLRVPTSASKATLQQLIEEWLQSGQVEKAQGNLTIIEPGRVRIKQGEP